MLQKKNPCAARSARHGSRSIRGGGRQPSAVRPAASAPTSSEDGRARIRWSCWPGTLIPPGFAMSSGRRCAKLCLQPVSSFRLQHQSRNDAVPLFGSSTSDLCPALRARTLIAGSYSSGLLNPRPRPPPPTDGTRCGNSSSLRWHS
jgi:hypothetical protein